MQEQEKKVWSKPAIKNKLAIKDTLKRGRRADGNSRRRRRRRTS